MVVVVVAVIVVDETVVVMVYGCGICSSKLKRACPAFLRAKSAKCG
jgi:hypothetical protein